MYSNNWKNLAKGLLKSELAKRNVSYVSLVNKLEDIGVKENPENINNKINRGTFSTIFFLQCLQAIGCKSVRTDIEE
ncbi:MAG TPA: hypothetical protein ENI76_01520 [Ignavibacteria bacterium]|nr:hypothetical protein [Ignavibacteria bacterium]